MNISLGDILRKIQDNFPFKWSDSIPYLGIKLTPMYSTLYTVNYPPLIRELTCLLESWNKTHISWMGRIHALKMTFLPKLLYPFRVLPVLVPPHILRSLQRLLFKFVWGSVRPRLNRHLLYKSKAQGGLGIPNLTYYYKAAQIAPLVQLFAGKAAPLWTYIDVLDADPVPLFSLPWLPPQLRPKPLNPFFFFFYPHFGSLGFYKILSPDDLTTPSPLRNI